MENKEEEEIQQEEDWKNYKPNRVTMCPVCGRLVFETSMCPHCYAYLLWENS